jgi:hypothetical protein
MKRRELDRLLGRGRMSRPEKEAILEEALPPRARRGFAFFATRVLAPVAALGLVALVVVRLGGDGGWRAKGGGADAPVVDVGCGGACTHGGTLMFRVGHLREPAWLAAYAIAPSGERIWYFPTDAGELPELPAREASAVVPRGVRIGAEHAPGRYRVETLLLRQRLGRDAIVKLEGGRDLVGKSEQVVEVAP